MTLAVEHLRGAFDSVLADDYIRQVAENWQFTPHGGGLDGLLEAYEYDHDDPFPNAHGDVEQRFALLKDWLPKRLDYVQKYFGDHAFPLRLERSMTVTRDELGRFAAKAVGDGLTADDVGIYWAADESHSESYKERDKPLRIILYATVPEPGHVNWTETLKSRIDFDYGDEESEIQLHRQARLHDVGIEIDGKQLNLTRLAGASRPEAVLEGEGLGR